MARTSKFALITAIALAMLAVLTGPLLMSVTEAHADTATQSSRATAYTASGAQDDGMLHASGGQNGRGVSRGDRVQRMDSGIGDFDRRADDSWKTGDILQWIAIGILAGLAIALAIWRPWRPRHGSSMAAAGATPATYHDTATEAPVAAPLTAQADVTAATMAPAATPAAAPGAAPPPPPNDVPAPPAPPADGGTRSPQQ